MALPPMDLVGAAAGLALLIATAALATIVALRAWAGSRMAAELASNGTREAPAAPVAPRRIAVRRPGFAAGRVAA